MDLQNFIQKINNTTTYLLAVSGGIDSMVMLDLFIKNNLQVEVAHCNFSLRGAESDADMQFVKDVCKQHNIVCNTKVLDTQKYMQTHKLGVQESARNLRYQWFADLLVQQNLQYICTAHHANDTIETVLMNIVRGTGIKGLLGIPFQNQNVIRPLLEFTKKEIENYATENKIQFRTDASNATNKYSRNAFRNIIIPAMVDVYPEAEKNILHNIERWKGVEKIYTTAIEKIKNKLLEKRKNDFYIAINLLKKQEAFATILFELLQPFGFTALQINEVEKLLKAESGKYIKNDYYKIVKHNDFLIITKNEAIESTSIWIEDATFTILTKDFDIAGMPVPKPQILPTDRQTACIDIAKITFPLLLRPYQLGDYFYPLGMPKKKKISRFLIDTKTPQHLKEKTWVLEHNNKIIWIVGHRMDDRYKVTNSTKSCLQIQVKIH